jgi:transposase InsO family protein
MRAHTLTSAQTRPSKNKLTTDHLKIACRHVRELRAAGVTENLAIRSLEQFADFYAKMHGGGSATPHHVRQVPRQQWSVAARGEYKRNHNPSRRHSALGYLSPIEYERKHDGLSKPA